MAEPVIRIVSHRDLTPRWDIYKARTPGYMRWTHEYTFGPGESNPFGTDPIVEGALIHLKLFSLAPYNIQPPHKHDESDVIFAVVRGEARFLAGPEGSPVGMAGPFDVVHVPHGVFYGSINTSAELFQAFVVLLPILEHKKKVPYNLSFPLGGASESPDIGIPKQGSVAPKQSRARESRVRPAAGASRLRRG